MACHTAGASPSLEQGNVWVEETHAAILDKRVAGYVCE
jgi:hypothetical protein